MAIEDPTQQRRAASRGAAHHDVTLGRGVGSQTPASLAQALAAADELETFGLSTTVADARFAKPLDGDLIDRLAREHEVLILVEEGAIGGFASHVLAHLSASGALDGGLKVRALVMPDRFIDQAKPPAQLAEAGLDAGGIAAAVLEALGAAPELAGTGPA